MHACMHACMHEHLRACMRRMWVYALLPLCLRTNMYRARVDICYMHWHGMDRCMHAGVHGDTYVFVCMHLICSPSTTPVRLLSGPCPLQEHKTSSPQEPPLQSPKQKRILGPWANCADTFTTSAARLQLDIVVRKPACTKSSSSVGAEAGPNPPTKNPRNRNQSTLPPILQKHRSKP